MSVNQTKIIDLIGIEKSTGHAVLTIADHRDWKNVQQHLCLLQAKINSYLAFVESEEIFECYPDARGRQIVISVTFQFAPPPEGLSFLLNAKLTIEAAGFGFRFEVLDEQSSHST